MSKQIQVIDYSKKPNVWAKYRIGLEVYEIELTYLEAIDLLYQLTKIDIGKTTEFPDGDIKVELYGEYQDLMTGEPVQKKFVRWASDIIEAEIDSETLVLVINAALKNPVFANSVKNISKNKVAEAA